MYEEELEEEREEELDDFELDIMDAVLTSERQEARQSLSNQDLVDVDEDDDDDEDEDEEEEEDEIEELKSSTQCKC